MSKRFCALGYSLRIAEYRFLPPLLLPLMPPSWLSLSSEVFSMLDGHAVRAGNETRALQNFHLCLRWLVVCLARALPSRFAYRPACLFCDRLTDSPIRNNQAHDDRRTKLSYGPFICCAWYWYPTLRPSLTGDAPRV